MEILFIIIGLAVVIWLFDFDKPIRQVAAMANREVALQDAAHKAKAVKAYSKLELKDGDIKKAKSIQAMLESFDI